MIEWSWDAYSLFIYAINSTIIAALRQKNKKCIKFQPIKKSTIQPREIDQVGVELMEERLGYQHTAAESKSSSDYEKYLTVDVRKC